MESSTHSKQREKSLRSQQSPLSALPDSSSDNPDAVRTSLVDDRLQRLEQLASLGTISAGLAHEIKNAMVAIRTFVEMLIAQNKQAELAEVVKREVLRIDSIVSQLLRLAGNPKPRSAEFRLTETLERCLGLVDPQLKVRSIQLKRRFGARQDMIEGDADRLEQAFINILLNAIEAIGQKGELSVTTTLEKQAGSKNSRGSTVHICVRDTGPGISPEDLPRIFEPFYTSKPEGTGLGLAITREIIEQHRGTISVESEPGKGTSFHISLPVAPVVKKRAPGVTRGG